MSNQSIKVPDLGGATNVEVIELCITVGDEVSEGQSLIVVESDKASMEIPSPVSGKILSIQISEGAEVSQGDIIAEVESGEPLANGEPSAKGEPSANREPSATPTDTLLDEQVAADLSSVQAAESGSAVTADKVTTTSQLQTIVVPDLGGANGVEMIELLVAVGDQVGEGDGLMVLESDKASMELPSPLSGTVKAILVEVGAMLAEGQAVAEVLVEGASEPAAVQVEKSAPADKTATQPKAVTEAAGRNEAESLQKASSSSPAVTAPVPGDQGESGGEVYAGPAVRKLARELGVDLTQVKGSGPKGRVSKEDLHEFVRQAVSSPQAGRASVVAEGTGIPQVLAVDFSAFGEVDEQPMSRLHKLTASSMQRSWLNVPHVTQFDEADITALEEFRQSLKPEMQTRGVKLSPLPFILKAVSHALAEIPLMNASLGEGGSTVVYKKYFHIGVAVDTPAGLFVPVIRDVDKKGIWEIAAEIVELADKAKNKKLTPAEMQGGCFTVSSLGNIGGQGFTPIVNTPEAGILGVSRAAVKPIYIESEFQPRTMLPLTLSYDHRLVNGGDGGRFLNAVIGNLVELRRLLL